MGANRQGGTRGSSPYPFSSLLQCVQCLAPPTRQLGAGGTGKKRRGRTLASARPQLRRTMCKCFALVEPPMICKEYAALLLANARAHMAQTSAPLVARPGLVSGVAHRRQRGLTIRSKGPPTARHQALVAGTLYIFCGQGLASHRRRPLTSNVSRQTTPLRRTGTHSWYHFANEAEASANP